MSEEYKGKLIALGYTGDFSLSNVIEWIRTHEKFNIWVEHGHTGKDGVTTNDVTTDLGCHRGSYRKYEEAQIKGVEIFMRCVVDKR